MVGEEAEQRKEAEEDEVEADGGSSGACFGEDQLLPAQQGAEQCLGEEIAHEDTSTTASFVTCDSSASLHDAVSQHQAKESLFQFLFSSDSAEVAAGSSSCTARPPHCVPPPGGHSLRTPPSQPPRSEEEEEKDKDTQVFAENQGEGEHGVTADSSVCGECVGDGSERWGDVVDRASQVSLPRDSSLRESSRMFR